MRRATSAEEAIAAATGPDGGGDRVVSVSPVASGAQSIRARLHSEWRRWRFPDPDLDADEKAAESGADEAKARIRSADLSADVTLEVIKEVVKAELDRETNLNTRGAAVASVAALVISIFAAILDASTLSEPWATSDAGRFALTCFLGALVLVAAAMGAAVFRVLKPMRGPQTKMFLSEQIIDLWVNARPEEVTDSEVKRRFIASSLATLPGWHYRNRRKARWLRRAYVLLGGGIFAIAGGATLVLHARAVFPLHYSAGVVAAIGALALFALRVDLFRAGQRREGAPPT